MSRTECTCWYNSFVVEETIHKTISWCVNKETGDRRNHGNWTRVFRQSKIIIVCKTTARILYYTNRRIHKKLRLKLEIYMNINIQSVWFTMPRFNIIIFYKTQEYYSNKRGNAILFVSNVINMNAQCYPLPIGGPGNIKIMRPV